MNTQTDTVKEGSECTSSAETAIGALVIGCFIVGGVGIAKALTMESGFDVLLCLLGSLAAYAMVLYIYSRKSLLFGSRAENPKTVSRKSDNPAIMKFDVDDSTLSPNAHGNGLYVKLGLIGCGIH